MDDGPSPLPSPSSEGGSAYDLGDGMSMGGADVRTQLLLERRATMTAALYRSSPYDLILYLERAVVHADLGYPDLAAADAYRALLLADEVEDEYGEYHEQALESVRKYVGRGKELPDVLRHGELDPDGVGSGEQEEEGRRRSKDGGQGVGEQPEALLTNGSAPAPFGSRPEDEEADEADGIEPCQRLAAVASVRCFQILALSLLLCGCLRSAATFAARGLIVAPENRELRQIRIYIQTMARRRLGRRSRSGTGAGAERGEPAGGAPSGGGSTGTRQDAAVSDGAASDGTPAADARVDGADADDGKDEPISLADLPDMGVVRREVYPWNAHEPSDRFGAAALDGLNADLAKLAPKCEVRATELPLLVEAGFSTNAAANAYGRRLAEKPPPPARRQLGLFATQDIAPGDTVLEEYSLLTASGRLEGDACDACSEALPEVVHSAAVEGTREEEDDDDDDEEEGEGESQTTGPVPCPEPGCDAVFCSSFCLSAAQRAYHPFLCGSETARPVLDAVARDPSAVARRDAPEALYLLLVARAMAMALHSDASSSSSDTITTEHQQQHQQQQKHPLDLPQIRFLWGDFLPSRVNAIDQSPDAQAPPPTWTLPWSWAWNVEKPLHVLAVGYGVDVFAELPRTEAWVLNTLCAKFRGVASARQSAATLTAIAAAGAGPPGGGGGGGVGRVLGAAAAAAIARGPEVAAVHPFWCLANHDCDPNVRWDWAARMVLRARERRVVGGGVGGIKKGDEIMSHYCDVDLPVRLRREWMAGSLGGDCSCRRCRDEDEAERAAKARKAEYRKGVSDGTA